MSPTRERFVPPRIAMLRFAGTSVRWLAILLALGPAGCGGEDGAGPGLVPAALDIVAGNGERAAAGTAVPDPPTVVVRDAAGTGLSGIPVTFTVTAGGGTAAPTTVTSGPNGQAAPTSWILGSAVGNNTLKASVGSAPALAAVFDAEAIAGPVDPARSTVAALPATIHTSETSTITVTARDAHGNAIAGVALHVTAGGAGNTIVQPQATNAEGVAAGTLASTAAGTKTISVEANGVTLDQHPDVTVEGNPVATEVVVDPVEPALLVDQTVRLAAEVRDAQGRPMPGATVTWASDDDAVARVSADGTVTARRAGSVTITATSGAAIGTARITVSLGEGTLTGVTYCTIGGVADLMDVYIPAASKPRPLPVAVHVHGGGWVSGGRSQGTRFDDLKDKLLDRGYLVVSLDYRLAPADKYPSQIEDVKCAVRHLRARAARYGLDPERIGAWGGSAGGQLVALLGTTDAGDGFDDAGGFAGESSRVQAVIAIAAITDFTRPDELHDDYHREFLTWPDPTSPEMIEASPVTHVSTNDAPFFFVVGRDDALVDNAQSVRMNQRLANAGVESSLLTVLHADHDLLPTDAPTEPSWPVIAERMADFLDRELR